MKTTFIAMAILNMVSGLAYTIQSFFVVPTISSTYHGLLSAIMAFGFFTLALVYKPE